VTDLTSKVPETLNGVIMTRIDALTCTLQLTLKVASVIGRTFSLPVLDVVHPIDQSARADIESQARVLEQCRFLFLFFFFFFFFFWS
jgi:predicted ATPase